MAETKATKNVDFAKIQAEIKNPTKDKENPHFGSRYVSRTNLLDVVLPVLNGAGLDLSQGVWWVNGERELWTLISNGSDFHKFNSVPLALDRAGPQGMGSAQTYASRYGIELLLGISGEEDDDGNAAQAEVKGKPTATTSTITEEGEPERTAGGASSKSYHYAQGLFVKRGIARKSKKDETDEESAARRDDNLMAVRTWLDSKGYEYNEVTDDPLYLFDQATVSEVIETLKAEIEDMND